MLLRKSLSNHSWGAWEGPMNGLGGLLGTLVEVFGCGGRLQRVCARNRGAWAGSRSFTKRKKYVFHVPWKANSEFCV